ncbi:MAG TPA: hypothetical protein VF475_11015 [Sphingobium sp.]
MSLPASIEGLGAGRDVAGLVDQDDELCKGPPVAQQHFFFCGRTSSRRLMAGRP